MFSEPGPDQLPPEEGRVSPVIRPADIFPTDAREGSQDETALRLEEGSGVGLTIKVHNVSNPPTEAELDAALGAAAAGDLFLVSDGGIGLPLWLVVRGLGGKWNFELLTEAV